MPLNSTLACVVQGLKSSKDFDERKKDGYIYETIGGNHRRLALQELLSSKDVDDADKQRITNVSVELFAGMCDSGLKQ